MDSSRTMDNIRDCRTYTLFLIRHGEASHNILEKAARQKARDEAVAEGFDEHSDVVQIRMEVASESVLNDDSLFDAPLSANGKDEAREARQKLKELVEKEGLMAPTEVLVSPLTRALQTADLIFPDHKNIRVRELLRERMTGKACDDRAPSYELARIEAFSRFSMRRLRIDSIAKLDLPSFSKFFRLKKRNATERGANGSVEEEWCIDVRNESTTNEFVEDSLMLRGRTKKLLDLLAESQHEHIAVVTHKGYLRELEKGLLHQTNVKEFENCQIKIYKATLTQDNEKIDIVKRIV